MKTDHSMLQEKQGIQIQMPKLISKLWIFLSLNYILCDLLTMMDKAVLVYKSDFLPRVLV